MSVPDSRIGVVIVTRDRCSDLMGALEHLSGLPEQPRIVVVDNASSDGTADAVEDRYPGFEVIPLDENLGAAGRNVGVAVTRTPYVAFSDDDSWWAPGSLSLAADLFDKHPGSGCSSPASWSDPAKWRCYPSSATPRRGRDVPPARGCSVRSRC